MSSWFPAIQLARTRFLPGIHRSILILHSGFALVQDIAEVAIIQFRFWLAISRNWKRIHRLGRILVIPIPVQYCLAQPENQPCRFLLEPRLTILMIVANIFILVVMVVSLMYYWHKLKHTLTCFGDVLASCLSSEESISDGMCLADKQHIDSYWAIRGRPVHLDSGKWKWQSIMSLRRHRILLGLVFIDLLACTNCLSYALYIVGSDRHLPISLSGLWQLGFGLNTKTSAFLTNLDGSPASLAMISNIP